MHRYVAFLPWGVVDTEMKNIVLIPRVVPCPCASQWISVALDACHTKPSELLLSSLYSASSPVSGLNALPCIATFMGRLGMTLVQLTAWHCKQCGFVIACVIHCGTGVCCLGAIWLSIIMVASVEMSMVLGALNGSGVRNLMLGWSVATLSGGTVWLSPTLSDRVGGDGFSSCLGVGSSLGLLLLLLCKMVMSCSSVHLVSSEWGQW